MRTPNILVVMPDQMVADVVRKDHPCLTPNIDRFAEQGIRFEQAYCTAPHCSPSRASFVTGEYPSKHGVWNNVANRCAISRGLNQGVNTFATALRAARYNLAYSGKWHVSDEQDPDDLGWDNLNPKPSKGRWAAGTTIQRYEGLARDPGPEIRPPGALRRPGWGDVKIYDTYEPADDDRKAWDRSIIERGCEAIENLARGGTPWCVFVSCNAPHDCYHAPSTYVSKYDGMEILLPESFTDTLEDKPRIYQRMRRQYWDQMGEDETKACIRHYWAMCTMVDDWFGRLLAALDATGQAEDTLVVFLSDHGDYAGAHGLWCKGVPSFREAHAIPSIVRWPAGITDPGRSVDALVSIADYMPTFVELAAGEAPDVYGDSLVPFFRGEQPSRWRDALHLQLNGVELYYTQRIVMTRRWKYVYNGFDYDELYDRENDPHETVNLAYPDRYDQSVDSRHGEYVPWPRMTEKLERVRKDMLARMWRFAREQEDHFLFTPYLTTAQAPYGPLCGM